MHTKVLYENKYHSVETVLKSNKSNRRRRQINRHTIHDSSLS